jgi:hypothetical protein
MKLLGNGSWDDVSLFMLGEPLADVRHKASF